MVDRLVRKDGIEQRLTQSLETALKLTEGMVDIEVVDGPTHTNSRDLACPVDGSGGENDAFRRTRGL